MVTSKVAVFLFCSSLRISIDADSYLAEKQQQSVSHPQLMPMPTGISAIPPNNSARDVFFLFFFYLAGMSVICILWQFVKAPLRMRVELCCGFYFSPAAMPDSRCMGVRFIHNGVWRFCRREFSKVAKCNSHNPAAIQIHSNPLFSLLLN